MATISKPSFRPTLAILEHRTVPAVSWHQGPVLSNVQSENLYLGSDWLQPAPYQTAGALESFGAMLVNSSFMDALTGAGYGVGRGTAYRGTVLPFAIDKRFCLTDAAIRNDVQWAIRMSNAVQPGSDSLYVAYVEPGVAVQNGNETSMMNFDSYHSAFWGLDAYGRWAVIPYAVVAYPGGPNVSSQSQGYRTPFDDLTDVASHETAEAVTDPVPLSSWYDNAYGAGGEIGDLTRNYHEYLNGYFVQLESNQYDQAMIVSNGPVYWIGPGGVFALNDVGGHWTRLSVVYGAAPVRHSMTEARFQAARAGEAPVDAFTAAVAELYRQRHPDGLLAGDLE